MTSVETIQSPELLRQAALLLERENAKLHEKVQSLTGRIAELEGRSLDGSQLELAYLKELLAQRERTLFGEKSERRSRPQSEAEALIPSDAAPRRGHGPRAQAELPIVVTPHELPTEERSCPACGGELSEMTGQSEDSEEISVVERRFVIVQHVRRKYRCACNGHVATAPAPLKLQSAPDRRGQRYGLDFAVEIALEKYLDHLPLERQVRKMAREGLIVDSQTLWDQILALAGRLKPVHDALHARVLVAPVVGADETWWRLMQGKGSKRWLCPLLYRGWAWVLTTDDAVVYRILDSRSQAAAREVLGNYNGLVVADGYGVYEALVKAGAGFRLAHCWAHVRRKFVEAEPHEPERCGASLDLVGELYAIERESKGLSPEERAAVRATRSRATIDEIRAWAQTTLPSVLPQSAFGKAIGYLLGLWDGLTRFLDDPEIPIDNNATERALRGAVIGRKNHYGSKSQRGTEVAALFYSLIETAKLVEVDPRGYLRAAATRALRDRKALLPHEFRR